MPELEPEAHSVRLYVDDQSLRVRRSDWQPVLGAVRKGLAAHGLRLRPDKSKAHCPAAQHDPGLEAQLAAELEGTAVYERGGLVVLGTVADGEYAARVVADGVDMGPVRKRAQQAEQLAAALDAMLDADIAGRARGPAFKIIAMVLNRALGFDLCVCPPGAVAPYAEALDERVAGLFRRLARASTADAGEEVRLALAAAREPRTHGGLALRAAMSEAPYAYLSTVVAVLPRVSADLEHAGLPAGAVHLALERTGVLPAARGC